MSKEIAEQTVALTAEMVANEENLVARVTDAKKALELSAMTYRAEWIAWKKEADGMLAEQRMWRMAIDSEWNRAMTSFADLRKFFLSVDHQGEVQRLLQFVELCERLKKLKDCGFLDQVADTILKLDTKP